MRSLRSRPFTDEFHELNSWVHGLQTAQSIALSIINIIF